MHIVIPPAVEHPRAHEQQTPQKAHKVFVIINANAVADPRAMMIKARHTPITYGTVL